MVSFLILAAAAGAVAILLVVRLCVVLQPGHVTPRESVGLLIVAGSGKWRAVAGVHVSELQTPECIASLFALLSAFTSAAS